tara:strand:- start:9853 stop:12477 length:2625 start_codon:yes stop_codon:yes gene_type:complete
MRLTSTRSTVSIAALAALLPGCFFKSNGGSISLGATSNPSPTSVVYLDLNQNGVADAGDELRMQFNRTLRLDQATIDDFLLAIVDDEFGAGATVALTDSANQVRVVLGANPRLKSRKKFNLAEVSAGSPSALNSVDTGHIRDLVTDGPAFPAGTPLDLVPGFVSGADLDTPFTDRSDHVLLVDLDCDGLLDLVRTIGNTPTPKLELGQAGLGKAQSSIEVLLGQPDGTFASEYAHSFDGLPTALGHADVNRDGHPDLLVGRDLEDVVFLTNSSGHGDVTLSNGFLLEATSTTTAILGVDLDQDGFVDIVVGDSEGVHSYRNLATLGFDALVSHSSIACNALAAGDMNGDGIVDVISATNGNDQILLGGFGQLTTGGQSQSATPTRHVAIADIDRDGDLDYVLAKDGVDVLGMSVGEAGYIEQALGDEDGSTLAVAILDVDGDGLPDLARAMGDVATGGMQLILNLGAGGGAFLARSQDIETDGMRHITSGDIDRDGDPDFVVDGADTRVWRGSLSGTWGDYEPLERTGIELGMGVAEVITEGDLNGDGIADVAIGGNQHVTLYYGLADGTFSPPAVLVLPLTRTQDILLHDMDLDGDLDMVVAVISGSALMYRNDGTGVFTIPCINMPFIDDVNAIGVGDLNGNGFPDLVFARPRTRADVVLFNIGFPPPVKPLGDQVPPCEWVQFISSGQQMSPESSRDVVVADLDCDGSLDLVFAHQNNISDAVWLNMGNGIFELVQQTLGLSHSRDLALADFNNDGYLDLGVATFSSDEIWHGLGGGFFELATTFASDDSSSCEARDLNGDGRADFITGGEYGVRIRYNSADTGLASDPSFEYTSIPVQDIHLAELSRDGTLQILMAGRDDKTTHRILSSR